MATCTAGVATGFNGPGLTGGTTASFTPAASDLLIAMVAAGGNTDASPPVSDTQSLGWTLIGKAICATSADSWWWYVANTLAANSSMTFTVTYSGTTSNGLGICICRVAGITRVGSAAIRQFSKLDNQTVSPVANAALGVNALTGNPTIEGLASRESGMQTAAGWTEQADLTWTAGSTSEMEYHTRDSGFTGTQTGWSDTLGTPYCVAIAELDTSAAGGTPSPPWVPHRMPLGV